MGSSEARVASPMIHWFFLASRPCLSYLHITGAVRRSNRDPGGTS
ncbi:hypothetical protein C8J38_102127 [Rhizobium sp. PP-WC-2G-219]|nr:hypothetical protein C8J32_102377 [Rhizobium sp. PP-CC-3A-592]TCL93705.1 hypothetical protein C8J38_102127 [Rhizobium sp. PP-WC-2G-219]